jgi:folate-binding Fe-S cluster repair protein YgfZ
MSNTDREEKDSAVIEGLDLRSYIQNDITQKIVDLKPDKFELSREELFFSSKSGKPKHSREEYKKHLGEINMKSLVENAVGEKK